MKTSVLGVLNVLGLANRGKARIQQASSEVYEDPGIHSYWGHVNPIEPRSFYDEGKRCVETFF